MVCAFKRAGEKPRKSVILQSRSACARRTLLDALRQRSWWRGFSARLDTLVVQPFLPGTAPTVKTSAIQSLVFFDDPQQLVQLKQRTAANCKASFEALESILV
jgi:hypothetical protein